MQTVVTNQPYPAQPGIGWHTVAAGISSGSWAVLLMLASTVWLLRKPIARYFEKHLEVLESLKISTVANSQTIATMAVTDEKVAQTLSSLADLVKDTHTAVKVSQDDQAKILALLEELKRRLEMD